MEILPGWVRRRLRHDGETVAILYIDPSSKPFDAADDELATRRLVATADALTICIDGLLLASGEEVDAFTDMLVAACHATQRLAQRKGVGVQSIADRSLVMKASRAAIQLQADHVELQSTLDLLGILRVLWAAWRAVERLRLEAQS